MTDIPYELGNLRRSTVISTFGPGAIVDFRAEEGAAISAVVSGLDGWDSSFKPAGLSNEQTINEERLQKRLHVNGFRLPPIVYENYMKNQNEDKRSIFAVRFPKWLQCPQCDKIAHSSEWSSEPAMASKYCASCTSQNYGQRKVHVVPVRFVLACEGGHLDEFPWHWWVNHKSNCKHKKELYLRSKAPGLSGLILECPKCGASKSMDGIFSTDTWIGSRCRGKRPWLPKDSDSCDFQPKVLQRGASNLYFPYIVSALSIPPWSDRLQEVLGDKWGSIVNIEDYKEREFYIKILAKNELKEALQELDMTPHELAKQIEERINKYKSLGNIRWEEYQQLRAASSTPMEEDNFEIRKVKVPENIKSYFNSIGRVVRLREVRAISGFTRINPPGDDNDKNIVPLSAQNKNWLPAIEVRGEGIFLEFNSSFLKEWEEQQDVIERANQIHEKWLEEWSARYGNTDPSPIITPRYLLIHTWAHTLMRQLTLECGYSNASLRERLYVDSEENDMAGILIYTATSDSDGTLGGLQRQGKPEKISRTVMAAIKAMEWCSSDPLCIEGMVASPENHSKAACHACCLSPETSCEQFNKFLDRAMLVGLPGKPEIGYFSSILQEE